MLSGIVCFVILEDGRWPKLYARPAFSNSVLATGGQNADMVAQMAATYLLVCLDETACRLHFRFAMRSLDEKSPMYLWGPQSMPSPSLGAPA